MTVFSDKDKRDAAERLRAKHRERSMCSDFEPQCVELQKAMDLDDLMECLPKRTGGLLLLLADLIDPGKQECCAMVDRGDYMPRHKFKRVLCSNCGRMHWEQPMPGIPRMRHCPWCGEEVTEWRKEDERV